MNWCWFAVIGVIYTFLLGLVINKLKFNRKCNLR